MTKIVTMNMFLLNLVGGNTHFWSDHLNHLKTKLRNSTNFEKKTPTFGAQDPCSFNDIPWPRSKGAKIQNRLGLWFPLVPCRCQPQINHALLHLQKCFGDLQGVAQNRSYPKKSWTRWFLHNFPAGPLRFQAAQVSGVLWSKPFNGALQTHPRKARSSINSKVKKLLPFVSLHGVDASMSAAVCISDIPPKSTRKGNDFLQYSRIDCTLRRNAMTFSLLLATRSMLGYSCTVYERHLYKTMFSCFCLFVLELSLLPGLRVVYICIGIRPLFRKL